MPNGAHDPFPPIADYGFLSDCETTALVAPSGAVQWLCLPRVDSPSVFGSILDRDAGWFRLGPADVQVPAARRYLPGTMVLETSWGGPSGWIIVRDALLMGPWHHEGSERSKTHKRAPTDYDASHVLRLPSTPTKRPIRGRRMSRCFTLMLEFEVSHYGATVRQLVADGVVPIDGPLPAAPSKRPKTHTVRFHAPRRAS